MKDIPFHKPLIMPIDTHGSDGIEVDVLRLDMVHPVISGNKWYKLQFYMQEALASHKEYLVTFGGAYSNHIMATAAAARLSGLTAIGIIRGERPEMLSPTLKDAAAYGMELLFISRENYKNKMLPPGVMGIDPSKMMVINEGGYGWLGAKGAAAILKETSIERYTHIIAAVGTGTMLAGLITAALPHQKITGIPVLKNNLSIASEITSLLKDGIYTMPTLLTDYHFGGYAKRNDLLISFMNSWFSQTRIPTDFVYTGKLFFALDDLIKRRYFPPESKVLVIHSGGLQGNRSLPKGTLIYEV